MVAAKVRQRGLAGPLELSNFGTIVKTNGPTTRMGFYIKDAGYVAWLEEKG